MWTNFIINNTAAITSDLALVPAYHIPLIRFYKQNTKNASGNFPVHNMECAVPCRLAVLQGKQMTV